MSRPNVRTLLWIALALALFVGACGKDEGLKITGVEPKQGNYQGGDIVTIQGTGFQSGGAKGVKVYFGNAAAKVLAFRGDDELRVEVPGGKEGETVDIEIIFDDSRHNKIEKAYKYINPTGLDVKDFAVPDKK